jgi:hypothetical protein
MGRARWALAGVAMASLMLSGCAVLLIGAGAAGGYAISKDSIKNHFDLSPTHVYGVSRQVAEETGLITSEDERRGLIKVKVENANVTISVRRISGRTVELQVRARNDLLLPMVDVAQAVFNTIVERL